MNTAFFYPPQEHYYLEDDEENLALLENGTNGEPDPWAGLTYNIYPNPVSAEPLQVEIYLPQAASVRVQLRNTMGLVVLDRNQGTHAAGMYRFQTDASGLPVGNYILNIQLNEKLIHEMLMKR